MTHRIQRTLKIVAPIAILLALASVAGATVRIASGPRIHVVGQSCARFAPTAVLAAAIRQPVRFEPTSGGSARRGWICWYYTADAQLNNLDVEVDTWAARAASGEPAKPTFVGSRTKVVGIVGDVIYASSTYGRGVTVIKSNGYFSIGSSVQNGRYDLLLSRAQLIAAARAVDRRLSR